MRKKVIISSDNIQEDEEPNNIVSLHQKRKTSTVVRKKNKQEQFSLEPFLLSKIKKNDGIKKEDKQDSHRSAEENVLTKLNNIVESINHPRNDGIKEPNDSYLLLTKRTNSSSTMPNSNSTEQNLPISDEDKLAEALLPHINKWLDDYMPRLIQHALQKRSKS